MRWLIVIVLFGLACYATGGRLAAQEEHSGRATADESSEPAHASAEETGPAGHDAHHAPHIGASGVNNDPAEFKSDLAIFTVVVFLLLLAVLYKFAWGPISAALDKRERTIADHIRAAEAQHEQARQLLVEHERKLAGASEEVRQLIEAARRDGEQLKGQILAEAKAAAAAEHERAMRDVRQAKDAALKEISEASANFAVELARKIIQRELTSADQQRLVREAVSKFPSVN